MKDLLIKVFDEVYAKFTKTIPLTKKEPVYVELDEVSPLDLPDFMAKNGIPTDNSYFGGKPNGYDGYESVCLIYHKDVPTTDTEQLKYCRERFAGYVWYRVRDALTAEGYSLSPVFYSDKLKQFKDTTVYDMYMTKDWERLITYYSLSFSPKI